MKTDKRIAQLELKIKELEAAKPAAFKLSDRINMVETNGNYSSSGIS